MGKKQFCFFQTAETGNRTPDSGVKGSGANHYPRAPAPALLAVPRVVPHDGLVATPAYNGKCPEVFNFGLAVLYIVIIRFPWIVIYQW